MYASGLQLISRYSYASTINSQQCVIADKIGIFKASLTILTHFEYFVCDTRLSPRKYLHLKPRRTMDLENDHDPLQSPTTLSPQHLT